MTTPDPIALAGGADKVAQALKLSPEALRKWREKGCVPPKHWTNMARLSGLSLDEVASVRFGTKGKRRKVA